MEEVCERRNLRRSIADESEANKGAPGVDGMTVESLLEYLKQHWPTIREQLQSGTYEPQPVKRVEIPKPDGGVRKLGIPTVLDRFIQQAVLQVSAEALGPDVFPEHSYGFRPRRSAHQAVAAAQGYIAEGYPLGGGPRSGEILRPSQPRHPDGSHRQAGERQRMLRLIRAFLNAGVLEERVGESDG